MKKPLKIKQPRTPPMIARNPLAAAVALALAAGSAGAADIHVNGDCGLIDAIRAANDGATINGCTGSAGADTIILEENSTHTLTASFEDFSGPTGLPVVTSAITIQGNGSTIKRASDAPENFRILAIDVGGDLTLEKTTLSGGSVPGLYQHGGGILNRGGDLTLNESTVSGNSARFGGGVANFGDPVDCESVGNYTYYCPRAYLTLNRSTLSGNSAASFGGGLINFYGYAAIDHSTLSENSALAGGAIDTFYGGGVGVHYSTVSGNSARWAGGINIDDAVVGVDLSLVSGNMAEIAGGGVATGPDASLRIDNSTLSGNSAGITGGGIEIFHGTVTLNHSTVSDNSAGDRGGGVHQSYFTFGISITNTVVAGNIAPDGPELWILPSAFSPPVNADNHNLFGFASDPGIFGFDPAPSDIVPDAPLEEILDPLADNGGPTLTHALPPGSPAIDAADPDTCGPQNDNPTDQRGEPRPGIGSTNCDIGAFEFQGVDEIDPLDAIDTIIAFFDTAAATGDLLGVGPGNAGSKRMEALRKKLANARNQIARGNVNAACQQLRNALWRTDGRSPPPDFVAGPAAPQLAAKIEALRRNLGC